MSMEFGNTVLSAGTATASGNWQTLPRCYTWSATARVTVTAATLQATLKFLGTDFDAKSGSEALFTGFTLASVLGTGVTYAAGVITFNNPVAATYEVVLTAVAVPRWLQPVWTYTSGGGTVAAAVCVSGW